MLHDTEHFKVREFACKHCGENKIDQRVIDMAEVIRARLGVPVKVNSGYRCEFHNTNVGGKQKKFDKNGKMISKGSNHMYGLAADLACSLGSAKIFETCKALYNEGKLPALDYCQRYCKKNFVHIDCGGPRNNRFVVVP